MVSVWRRELAAGLRGTSSRTNAATEACVWYRFSKEPEEIVWNEFSLYCSTPNKELNG